MILITASSCRLLAAERIVSVVARGYRLSRTTAKPDEFDESSRQLLRATARFGGCALLSGIGVCFYDPFSVRMRIWFTAQRVGAVFKEINW